MDTKITRRAVLMATAASYSRVLGANDRIGVAGVRHHGRTRLMGGIADQLQLIVGDDLGFFRIPGDQAR